MKSKTLTADEIEEITCPHCGECQGLESYDSGGELITYWGEEAMEWECSECKKTFLIQEMVSRYWETAKDLMDF